jgi:hypothetical protein
VVALLQPGCILLCTDLVCAVERGNCNGLERQGGSVLAVRRLEETVGFPSTLAERKMRSDYQKGWRGLGTAGTGRRVEGKMKEKRTKTTLIHMESDFPFILYRRVTTLTETRNYHCISPLPGPPHSPGHWPLPSPINPQKNIIMFIDPI